MAWTAPMTAVLNAVFTASQFNTHVRDNLLETEVALATTAGSMFWTTAANSMSERLAKVSNAGACTVTSTTYADPATGDAGPSVTLNTGTQALVFWSCRTAKSGVNSEHHVSYEVTGASAIAATDTNAFRQDAIIATDNPAWGMFNFQTGLTEGNNTFTLKYRVSSITATVGDRQLFVLPL